VRICAKCQRVPAGCEGDLKQVRLGGLERQVTSLAWWRTSASGCSRSCHTPSARSRLTAAAPPAGPRPAASADSPSCSRREPPILVTRLQIRLVIAGCRLQFCFFFKIRAAVLGALEDPQARVVQTPISATFRGDRNAFLRPGVYRRCGFQRIGCEEFRQRCATILGFFCLC
jgi:hypothetical protein